jgi:hypothetical protein
VAAWLARQPLVVRAIVAIVVVAGLRVAVLLHVIPPDTTLSEDQVQDWIDGIVVLLSYASTHRKVTSVADPRDDNGHPLVPAGSTPLSRGEEP